MPSKPRQSRQVAAVAKMINKLQEAILGLPEAERELMIYSAKASMHGISSRRGMPVDNVQWVPVEKVVANDWNPNLVAKNELRLLYMSIMADGYTQPVVCMYDHQRDVFVIVDGFHRRTVCHQHAEIREKTGGCVPIVVINKPINDRMASTVRHNRARGKHQVSGMANIVFSMLENGWTDETVCSELGLEADELVRLKYVTGFAKLFADVEYRKAWETRKQLRIKRDYVTANGSIK